jgi:hypothetical protein
VYLASQDPWVTAGDPLILGLRIDPGPKTLDDFTVAVTVCQKVQTRSEFTVTLQDRVGCGHPEAFLPPVAVSALPLSPDGNPQVQMPLADVSRDPGVYPVHVELRPAPNGTAVDQFNTHAVVVGPPSTNLKLGVALVLPVSATPTVSASGTATALRLDPLSSERLSGLVSEIATHPTVPLTLRPAGATIDALAASDQATDAATLQTLASEVRSTGTRQLISDPYADIDLAAMVAGGLGDEVNAQMSRGGDELERLLASRPDPRTWVADAPVGRQAVAALNDRGVDRLLLPEPSLVPLQQDLTATRPFVVEPEPGRELSAIAPDPGLGADFASTDDPVLAAEHLLADLAVIYSDAPGSRTPRVVVAAPDRSWTGTPLFVRTVLDGLATSPLLQGVTLDQAFTVPLATSARVRSSLVRTLAPTTVNPDHVLPGSLIRSSRHRLDGFGGLLDRNDQQASDLFDGLDRSLLLAEAGDLRPRARDTAVQAVDRRIQAQLKLIHLSNTSSIRLTARSGEIPVTVISDAPYPMQVVLEIQSDKLQFPHGSTKAVDITRRNTTSTFTVEARTSGVFGLRVSMQSPSGDLLVGERHVTVRSTAASDVGVVISIGAGLFLLVWWIRHLRHGRRAKRLVAA